MSQPRRWPSRGWTPPPICAVRDRHGEARQHPDVLPVFHLLLGPAAAVVRQDLQRCQALPGYSTPSATDLNDRDAVSGFVITADNRYRAVRWDRTARIRAAHWNRTGRIVDLGVLPEYRFSTATGITMRARSSGTRKAVTAGLVRSCGDAEAERAGRVTDRRADGGLSDATALAPVGVHPTDSTQITNSMNSATSKASAECSGISQVFRDLLRPGVHRPQCGSGRTGHPSREKPMHRLAKASAD